MKGNEALAEAAIRAGCKCFFGYPITPQTEISAYLAKRFQAAGGVFLQAESEIAAINMVLGAASTGVRAMTSSSSPGISLKSTFSAEGPDLAVSSPHRRTTGRLQRLWDTATFSFWYLPPTPFRKWLTLLSRHLTLRTNTVCPL